MATKNLISSTEGKIKVQKGNGYPNHFAPKDSTYVDIDTGNRYKNLDSTDNGWVIIEKGETKEPLKIKEEPLNKLKNITDQEMFLIENPESGMIAFNTDRKLAVIYNGRKWVSLLNEELHPIIFKDDFYGVKFAPYWSVINGKEKNFWTIGKAKDSFDCAYITHDGKANTAKGKESNVHIFFDTYIPKGIFDLRLYMKYVFLGSSSNNNFGLISIAPVTYFPKAGEMVDERFIKHALFKNGDWTKAYSSLGNTYAGKNARIILSWHNELIKREIESLHIENISLEYIK